MGVTAFMGGYVAGLLWQRCCRLERRGREWQLRAWRNHSDARRLEAMLKRARREVAREFDRALVERANQEWS